MDRDLGDLKTAFSHPGTWRPYRRIWGLAARAERKAGIAGGVVGRFSVFLVPMAWSAISVAVAFIWVARVAAWGVRSPHRLAPFN